MPTQIFVSITAEVRNFLDSCQAECATKWSSEQAIDLDELQRLVAEHNDKGGPNAKLHEVLAGAEVVSRKQVLSDRELTPVEKMRLETEERRYQKSIAGVAPLRKKGEKTDGSRLSEGISFATNFATQVFVAFIGSFLFGYFFIEIFVAPDNFPAKIIFGALCSFAALLVETCLLVVREQKQQMIGDRDAKLASAAAARREASAAAARARKAAASAAAGTAPAAQECGDASAPTKEKECGDAPAPAKGAQDKKDD